MEMPGTWDTGPDGCLHPRAAQATLGARGTLGPRNTTMMMLLQTIALVGGTVHSMTPGSEPTVSTILIEDGKIAAIGAEVDVPEGAEVLDVTGLHVAPGLIDASAHYDPEHDALYLASGVTLICDTGNEMNSILSYQRPEMRELGPGPELWISGQIIDGPGSAMSDAFVFTDAQSAVEQLISLAELLESQGQSIDFYSIREGLPLDAWGAMLATAHEAGMQVWGPKPAKASLAQLLASQQDGVFGLGALLPPDTRWDQLDAVKLGQNVQAVAESGLAVTPMLGVYQRMLQERADRPDELDLLSPHYEVRWQDERATWAGDLGHPDVRLGLQTSLDVQRGVLRRLHESGARLVPGTGSPNSWLVPGRALHDEFEQWAEAGIPAAAILHAATAGAAEALGMADQRGSLQVGLVADLVVLGLDPTTTIAALREPEIVVVRGRVLERDQLLEALGSIEDLQAKVREDLAAPLEVAPPEMPTGELVISGTSQIQAHGLRLGVESWAVVERPDGNFAYGSRLVTPATAASVGNEVHVIQEVGAGRLLSFDVTYYPDLNERAILSTLEKESRVVTVKGRLVGANAQMQIERRKGGIFIENKASPMTLAALSSSPTMAGLIAARHFPGDPLDSYVLSFEGEDLTPFMDRWRLRIQDDIQVVLIGTSLGWHQFGVRADGTPVFGRTRVGNAHTMLVPENVVVHRDGGLEMRSKRVMLEAEVQDGNAPGAKDDAVPLEAGVDREDG